LAGLFAASFDVLLYDLRAPIRVRSASDDEDKRRFGYSRDKRGDCVQVVIALVVTPQGFPLAYEVLPGNTSTRRHCALSCKRSRRTTARRNASG